MSTTVNSLDVPFTIRGRITSDHTVLLYVCQECHCSFEAKADDRGSAFLRMSGLVYEHIKERHL